MSIFFNADPTYSLRHGLDLSFGQRISMVAALSWPAIMAQLSSILMEYIDSAMVGQLGASASASIGLVVTTTWLLFGIGSAACSGFSVQVAHLIGAKDEEMARSVLRQSIIVVSLIGILIATIGALVAPALPVWLGGGPDIVHNASTYFLIFSLAMPVLYIFMLMEAMLRCAGNMMVPGILAIVLCLLDVVFNFFLIFDSRYVNILGFNIYMPGAGLGVTGAALGSVAATVVVALFLFFYSTCRFKLLRIFGHDRKGSWRLHSSVLRRALYIALPLGAERILMSCAQIVLTIIVAPLGTVAIAANAFAITAEGLCYMPGYGISEAATTLVGQSIGARRHSLTKSFGRISIFSGMLVMSGMGLFMWFGAPWLMQIFTPDISVQALGVKILRIEAWAEPMFAAAIVTYGVFIGAGYTLVPACINLTCMWIVRISLAACLAPIFGLEGVWLAMCIELCLRGALFLILFAIKSRKNFSIPDKQYSQS